MKMGRAAWVALALILLGLPASGQSAIELVREGKPNNLALVAGDKIFVVGGEQLRLSYAIIPARNKTYLSLPETTSSGGYTLDRFFAVEQGLAAFNGGF